MDKTKTHSLIAPTTALILALLYSSVVALHVHVYVPMLFPLLFLGWLCRAELLMIVKRLIMLNALVAIVVLSIVLQQNYEMALFIFLRSNMILLFILMLFHNADEFSIAIAMQQLHLPHKLTSVFFFTAKSIFLIRREFALFKNTLHVRGFSPKTNSLTYKTIAGFVGLLFIKALQRSIFLQKAMLLRGFQGQVYTLHSVYSLKKEDIILSLFTFLALTWYQGVLI